MKYENDIRAIIKALDKLMLDPFELKETINDEAMVSPLINVATGLVPGNLIAESLLSSFGKGKQCMKDFKRIQAKDVGFHEPLPQLKLKIFTATRRKSRAVKDKKIKSFSADRELFRRLMVIAKSRDLDLRLLFKHELSSVPMSLAHPDGSMRKAVKSRLLNELETFVTPINQLPKIAGNEIWIIDGMALIQMMSVKGLKTFGDLSDAILKMVMKAFQNSSCQRVDVTFDRYDAIDSIKSFERRRHQKSVSFEMKISGPRARAGMHYQSNGKHF